MSLHIRLVRGVFAGGTGFLVNMLQALVQVPLLLHYWGAEKMGAWLSLMAVGVLMTAMDFGHHAYLGNKLNRLYVSNHGDFLMTLGSGIRISLLVGFIPLAFIVVVYGGFDLRALLAIPASQLSNSKLVFLLIVQVVQWNYTFSIGGLLAQLYVAKGEFARYTYWGTVYRLLSALCLFAAIFLGASITGVVITQAIFCVIYHVVQWIDLRYRYPDCYPWWNHGSVREGWRNYRLSLLLTLNIVGQQLLGQGLLLLVARMMGSASVPLYSATRTIVNVAQTGNGIIINPLIPEVGRLDALGDHARIMTTLRIALTASTLILLAGFVVAVWITEPLFKVWTHGNLPFDELFLLLLLTAVALRISGSALMGYLISANDLRGQTWATWINTAIVFSLGATLMPSLGLKGLGLGMVLGELIGSILLPLYLVCWRFKKMLDIKTDKLFETGCVSMTILLASGLLCMASSQHKNLLTILLLMEIIFYGTVYFKDFKGIFKLPKPSPN